MKLRRAVLASLAVAWALCLAPMSVPDAAAEPPPAKDWEVEITPYGWLPMVHGQVDTPRASEDFTISFGDVIDSIDLGAMGHVKLRWKRWVALFDVVWANLSEDGGLGDSRVRYHVKEKGGWFEALGGYRVYEKPGGLFGTPAAVERRTFAVDALGGLTYSWFETRLKLTRDPFLEVPQQHRTLTLGGDWVAPYLGFRFTNDFTDHLRHETLLGVGGFGVGKAPHVSWQATSLFSYAVSEHVALSAGYRALGMRDPNLKLTFHGPIIGVAFRFSGGA